MKSKKIKSPWDFSMPPYDQRSSCYLMAGTDYGMNYKPPVGHKESPKQDVPSLPRHKKVFEAK